MDINPGDRVVTKNNPDEKRAGVVVSTREGSKGGRPAVEIEVEFRGTEWFYPYRATFKPDELAVLGHGAPLPERPYTERTGDTAAACLAAVLKVLDSGEYLASDACPLCGTKTGECTPGCVGTRARMILGEDGPANLKRLRELTKGAAR